MTDDHARPRLLLSIKEAAGALSVSTRTVYALIDAGRIETVHIGRAVRIPTDALESYVARLRQQETD